MRADWFLGSLLVFLTISKAVFAGSPEFPVSSSRSGDESRKLADEIRGRYLLDRYLFSPYPNDNQQNAHYGRRESSLGSDGIPFRPVRRLGSEFLGKRSSLPYNEDPAEGLTFEKRRVMGSEFLGKKRRLGSEFLGKRASKTPVEHDMEEDTGTFQPFTESGEGTEGSLNRLYLKRALGSEFLGKRAGVPLSVGGDAERGRMIMAGLYNNWSLDGLGSPWASSLKSRQQQVVENKRRMMGSEFLGKRSIGPNNGVSSKGSF